MRIASWYLVVAACGGGGQSPPEAGPLPPDTPVTLTPHDYVVDSQRMPTNNSEARDLGLDLNGDAVVDNQLGMVIATLAGQGLDTQIGLTRSVDRGETLVLAELGLESFAGGAASFTLFQGENPQPPACNGAGDTTCRHHLDGSATFDVAAGSARDTPLAGSLMNGLVQTGLGGSHLHLQTTMLTATPLVIELLGARVKLTGASETGFSGVIGGAITMTELDTNVLPQWQISFDASVQAVCTGAPPDCGCPSGSTGKSLHDLFDTSPNDCSISLAEIQNNSLIQSLLAPDVTIEGQQALSLGIGVTAVAAKFAL